MKFNIHKVISTIREKAEEEFPLCEETSTCDNEEVDIASKVYDLLKDLVTGKTIIESDSTLVQNDNFETNYCFNNIEDSDDESESQTCSQEWEILQTVESGELQKFDIEYMRRVVECFDKYGFKRVAQRFKRVKDRPEYISRFRTYLDNFGTKQTKLKQVWSSTSDRFFKTLEKRETIHDYDIQRWGMQEAKRVGLLEFKASRRWLHAFKVFHRVVSRKITKFVTDIEIESPEAIKETAKVFVELVKTVLGSYKPDEVFNTDQSGFNYLLKHSRMHDIKGVKTVVAHTQSLFKQTHSYTVQPIISMAGRLVGPVYICFQEKDGRFGPRVQKDIEQVLAKCKNVVVSSSKSGKLTKEHVVDWVERCLEPSVDNKCLLLLDSWSGQKDNVLFAGMKEKLCERLTIPPKTTSISQPLDVYGFRQLKIFTRRITSLIALDDLDIDITLRNNIIQMHSLVFNQLAAPLFRNMWLFAWHKSEYLEERPPTFLNVTEALFQLTMEDCETMDCGNCPFIQCAHCRKFLCFDHFFVSFHFHEDDEMSQESE